MYRFVVEAFLLLALAWLSIGTVVAGWVGRKTLAAAWREPVLKRPVMILESDDWGAGPLEQAQWLERIAAVLDCYADRDGRKPVMTLGLVLGVADGASIATDALRAHHRKSLADPKLAPVLAAIRSGSERGVFALQLHGGEHYWPPALLAAARNDPGIAGWFSATGIPRTEELPSALQSRWIDASALPSKPLTTGDTKAAALAEAVEFRSLFGREPAVAVPPTFVWNDSVEAAWAEAGVRFVVTPGRRYEALSAYGEPAAAGPAIVNGDRGAVPITYVVRNDYFEPARGHKAERALQALTEKTRLGRPTLLETHRANFLGGAASDEVALGELDRLLKLATRAFPRVAFLSTEELGERSRRADPWLVDNRLVARLHVCILRLWRVSRMRKLAWASGVIVLGTLLYALTGSTAQRLFGE